MTMMDYDEVRKYIEASSLTTAIYIGCDSQRHRKNKKSYASFARTVIVHIDGKHGCKVFGDVVVEPDYGNMRQRLMKEVEFVLQIFEEIYLSCGDRPFEVHIDVNPNPTFKSNVVISEAIGWVRGVTGIEPIVKPDAFAASHCADRGAKRRI